MKKTQEGTVDSVLRDYLNPALTTSEIAQKHGICPATVTLWVREAGLTLRSRGRRRRAEPTPRHQKIIELSRHLRLDQVGANMGLSKQAVHRILKRWEGWQKSDESPFVPGDVVLWQGKRLVVVSADKDEGTLIEQGSKKVYQKFPWAGNRKPKKIDVDSAYIVQA